MQTLNHKQVVALIKAVGTHRTVVVQGEAGCGKTSILYELAADPFFANYHVVNPIDMTQMSDGSVWVPDTDREAGVSRELPNERFGMHVGNRKGVDGSMPLLICLDEIAKARQYIKDTMAPIIFERRLGDFHMPDGSIVFGCTNLAVEGLGDSMQAHLRDRIIPVIMRKPTAQEWIEDFAVPKGLHAAVIASVTEYPQVFASFMDYEVGGALHGQNQERHNPYIFNPRATQDKWVTGRSLHATSDILNTGGGLDDETLQAAIAGTVGRAFTGLLMAYVRFGKSLPAFGHICADPLGTPIPANPAAQVMLAFRLLTQASDRLEAEAVAQYMSRITGDAKLLFTKNVSVNSKKMGIFARSETFTKLLAASTRILNAR